MCKYRLRFERVYSEKKRAHERKDGTIDLESA